MSSTTREFKALTEQQITGCLRKIEGRLKPELVSVYTHVPSDDDGDDEGDAAAGKELAEKGMRQLSDLRALNDSVKALRSIVNAVNSKDVRAAAFLDRLDKGQPVSYTHLTLPTICSV
eukprot:13254176-Alexandrium_andersonii.AAC.1